MLIGGDFNAKSPMWGETKTDNREEKINEWTAEMDLVILNEGTEPTFVRGEAASIIDLTIVNQQVARMVKKTRKSWRLKR